MGIILLLAASFPTFAFTLNNDIGAAFRKEQIAINVASDNCQNIGIDNLELLELAGRAAGQFWNKVPTSSIFLKKGELVNVSNAFRSDLLCTNVDPNQDCDPNPALVVDSDVLIACNDNLANYNNRGSVLGVTLTNNISGRTILGSLILINDHASNQFKDTDNEGKLAALAHEIGHAIGLGHSRFNRCLMYSQLIATHKALSQEDVDGVTWLYPANPLDGCAGLTISRYDDYDFPPSFPLVALLAFLFALSLFKLLRFLTKF